MPHLLDLRANGSVLHMILKGRWLVLRLVQDALHHRVLEDC